MAALLVGGSVEDHARFAAIAGSLGCGLRIARTRAEAHFLAVGVPPRAVICERELEDGDWKDVLADLEGLPAPPRLIVTSPHADERLWAEVLNLGGYDVLQKPLDANEAGRVLALACRMAPV